MTEDPQIKGEVLASPIRDWTDLEVWSYTLWRGLPVNEGYRYGLRRIGCLYCPFNGLWSRYLIRVLYPELDERWRSFLHRHAVKAGHPAPEHFAREGWRKRAGGRGLEHAKASVHKDVCVREEQTFTYHLARRWRESFWEYIRPFGTFSSFHDDGIIERGEITDRGTGSLVARVRISKPRAQLRISFAERMNGRLFLQRFERQIRKYQSCVLCGGCEASCPVGAISVNGSYRIIEDKCVGCLECVSAACVAVESLKRKGTTVSGRRCNGTV
ncbi:MAG: phosphoadenosine phosphosulfate reductase family protein [Chloroflexota bacterium]